MAESDPKTHSAPPERYSELELAQQSRDLFSLATLERVIDSSPLLTAILNDRRQVVLCNSALASAMGCDKRGVVGRRPGEVLDCVRLAEAPAGCGTAEGCATCG